MIDNETRITWLRERRLTFGELDPKLGFSTTVFLGLFEGEKYLENRLSEIKNQTDQSFFLLVVDNFSPEFNAQLIERAILQANINPGRWKIVRNPLNLGGFGSFQFNLDLIPSDWITFMHQDDSYKTNHLRAHIDAIVNSEGKIVTISSDMGSLDIAGKEITGFPRANWFLPYRNRHDIFLANVAMQVIPYPALSIKKEIVQGDLVPWSSVAFSDSEQTLRNLMMGCHRFIEAETVLYRENPQSESHIQSIPGRNRSAMLGLLRVFGSSDFLDFALELPFERREAFAEKVQQSTRIRIPDLDMADTVIEMVLEQLSHVWGYSERKVNEQASKLYLRNNQIYSSDLVAGANKFIDQVESAGFPADEVAFQDEADIPKKYETVLSAPPSPSIVRRIVELGMRIIGKFPYKWRRRIYKSVVSFYSRLRPGNKWDFNW